MNDFYGSVNQPGFTSIYASSPMNGSYHQPTMILESTAKPVTDEPPFDDTEVIHPIITSFNQQLVPEIAVRIPKGFFQVDGNWTCYRRNNFIVSCSFSFRTSSYGGQLYLQRHSSHQAELIKQFAVSISAKTAISNSQESEVRALVQYTRKGGKATKSIPEKVTIQPAPTPSSSGALPSNGNLYSNTHQVASSGLPYLSTQHQDPPTSHTFERIQFQRATANNGKRRTQQQHFHIVVELSADVSPRTEKSPHWVKIATKQSERMVVRGRPPGHYKDSDRGSVLLGSSPSHPSPIGCESSHRSNNSMGGYSRAQEQNIPPPSDISPTDLGNIDPALAVSFSPWSTVLVNSNKQHCVSCASNMDGCGGDEVLIRCSRSDASRLW